MIPHDSARRESTDAHLYLLTTMVLFGSAFTSSKILVSAVPHEVAAALRFGGGAVVLLALVVVLGRRSRGTPFTRAHVLRAAAVGLIGVFAYNLLFFWGLSLAPSIDGSVIVPVLSPVITTAVLLLTGRERASTRRLAGLGVGVAGAVVFFVGTQGVAAGADGARLAGDLIFLLGAFAWAAYSIASKKVLVGMDPLRATMVGTVAGALALLVPAAPVVGEVDWAAVPASAWANAVYLAVGPTAVAYLCYYRGLRVVSPSTATVAMLTVPVFGTAGAVLFLGESMQPAQIVGSVVMLVGALVAVTADRSHGERGRSTPAQPDQARSGGHASRSTGD